MYKSIFFTTTLTLYFYNHFINYNWMKFDNTNNNVKIFNYINLLIFVRFRFNLN